MKKNLLKFLALFMMSIFSSNIMAETETNPADATKDTDMLGVSYAKQESTEKREEAKKRLSGE